MLSEDDLLPVSALADLVFCERRAAMHHVEGVWEDNIFTVEGSFMHEKADLEGTTESRGDVRVARGLRLHSLRLGLTGKADVVEFHRMENTAAASSDMQTTRSLAVALSGISGLWQPFPVEYKRGHLRHEEGFEVQVCAQALCLEEMLNVRVPSGALFYGKSARRLDITFDASLRAKTEAAAERLHALFRQGKTPTVRYEKKCEKCSLMSLCMPKVTGQRRNVEQYLADTISNSD